MRKQNLTKKIRICFNGQTICKKWVPCSEDGDDVSSLREKAGNLIAVEADCIKVLRNDVEVSSGTVDLLKEKKGSIRFNYIPPVPTLKAQSVLSILQGTFAHRLVKYILPDLQKFHKSDMLELNFCNIVNVGSIARGAGSFGFASLKKCLAEFLPLKYGHDESDIITTLRDGKLSGILERSTGKRQKTFMYIRPVFSPAGERFLRITHVEWHVATEQLWFCFAEIHVHLSSSDFIHIFLNLAAPRTCLAFDEPDRQEVDFQINDQYGARDTDAIDDAIFEPNEDTN